MAYASIYESNELLTDSYKITQSFYERQSNRLDTEIGLEYSVDDLQNLTDLEMRRYISAAIINEIELFNSQKIIDQEICKLILDHIESFVVHVSPLKVNLNIFNTKQIDRLYELDGVIYNRSQPNGDNRDNVHYKSIHNAATQYVNDCLDTIKAERAIFMIKNYVSFFYFVIGSYPIVFILVLVGIGIILFGVLLFIYYKRKYVIYGCNVGYAKLYDVFTDCPDSWHPGSTDFDYYQIVAIVIIILGVLLVIVPLMILITSGEAKNGFIKSLVATCQLNALKIYAIQNDWTTQNKAFDFYTDTGAKIDIMDKTVVNFVTNKTNTALMFLGLTYREIYETPWAYSIMPQEEMSRGSLLLFQEFTEINAGVLLFFTRSLIWCIYLMGQPTESDYGPFPKLIKALKKNNMKRIRQLNTMANRLYRFEYTINKIRLLWHRFVVYPLFYIRLLILYSANIAKWTRGIIELVISIVLLFGQPAIITFLIYPVEKNLEWFSFLDRTKGGGDQNLTLTMGGHEIYLPSTPNLMSNTDWSEDHSHLLSFIIYMVAFFYHISGVISTVISIILTLLFHNSIQRTILVMFTSICFDIILGIILYTFNISLEKRIFCSIFKKLAPILPIEPRLSTTLCVANLTDKFHLIFIPELLKRYYIAKSLDKSDRVRAELIQTTHFL